jgi:hypothetical protein
MKRTKKVIPFLLLALFVMACEREEDATLVGEWQEVDSYNPDFNLNVDMNVMVERDTIVFYPDGRFQGSIILDYAYYSIIDGGRLSLEDENRNRIHLYSYSIQGNKLTLDTDSGMVPYSMGFPTVYIYKKINSTEL